MLNYKLEKIAWLKEKVREELEVEYKQKLTEVVGFYTRWPKD